MELTIDRVRFRDAVRIGGDEIHYAFAGGPKNFHITYDDVRCLVKLNGEYIPISNVTQFSLIGPEPPVGRKLRAA